MTHHYIYIGPFEKGALKGDRDWIAAARATLSVDQRYKIFASWNRELRRDHFLLLLFSPHSVESDDELRRLLRDALTALRGHWERLEEGPDEERDGGIKAPAAPSIYVLPSFDERPVSEPTARYNRHLAERGNTTGPVL